MTIPEIQLELKIPYSIALNSIERGDIYNFRRDNSPKNSYIHVMLISDEVSDYFGLRRGIINKKTRIKEVRIPRQIAQTISYNLTKSSNAFIGSVIGRKDHATVSNSRKMINELLSYKNVVKEDYLKLEKICRRKFNELDNESKK
jgi:chromosomal replication initiator protein